MKCLLAMNFNVGCWGKGSSEVVGDRATGSTFSNFSDPILMCFSCGRYCMRYFFLWWSTFNNFDWLILKAFAAISGVSKCLDVLINDWGYSIRYNSWVGDDVIHETGSIFVKFVIQALNCFLELCTAQGLILLARTVRGNIFEVAQLSSISAVLDEATASNDLGNTVVDFAACAATRHVGVVEIFVLLLWALVIWRV